MDIVEMEHASVLQDGKEMIVLKEHVLLIVVVMVFAIMVHVIVLKDGEVLIVHKELFVQMIVLDMVVVKISPVLVIKVGWEMIAH